MNRVIKFRLWDVENKEYFTEGFSVSMDGLFWYDDNGFGCRITPETYILEQFTGLHDKNGVECYEGDKDHLDWIVCFDKGAFVLKESLTARTFIPLHEQTDITITGNIHQTTTP